MLVPQTQPLRINRLGPLMLVDHDATIDHTWKCQPAIDYQQTATSLPLPSMKVIELPQPSTSFSGRIFTYFPKITINHYVSRFTFYVGRCDCYQRTSNCWERWEKKARKKKLSSNIIFLWCNFRQSFNFQLFGGSVNTSYIFSFF